MPESGVIVQYIPCTGKGARVSACVGVRGFRRGFALFLGAAELALPRQMV